MKDRRPGKKSSGSKRFASNGAKVTEVAEQSVASPATACSRQILSVTSAAVNALAEPKRTDVVDTNPTERSLHDDVGVAAKHFGVAASSTKSDSEHPSLDSSSNSSIPAAEKAILNLSNDSSSNSLRELSFSGTQRVRIPSRLLREIKSPVERTVSVTSDQIHGARGQGNKGINYNYWKFGELFWPWFLRVDQIY